jgi:hypothetical protein
VGEVIAIRLFPTSAVPVVLLSLAVEEHLQVDACARRFVICDPEINSADFSSLRELFSGMEIPEFARQAGTRTAISVEDVEVVPREEDGPLGEGEAVVGSDVLELR